MSFGGCRRMVDRARRGSLFSSNSIDAILNRREITREPWRSLIRFHSTEQPYFRFSSS